MPIPCFPCLGGRKPYRSWSWLQPRASPLLPAGREGLGLGMAGAWGVESVTQAQLLLWKWRPSVRESRLPEMLAS